MILIVLYVFVMLTKPKEQSIDFTIVSSISRNQMDLFEWSFLPSHSLNSGYMPLLKMHRSGISLPIFVPCQLSMKKVYLSPSGAKRVLMCIVLYFSNIKRINCTKNHPPRAFFGVFRLSKHENTNEHVLVQAHKIHELVTLSSIILSPLQSFQKLRETRVDFPRLVKI